MKKLKTTKPIESTYQNIKKVLEQARAQSYRAVNFAMVQAESGTVLINRNYEINSNTATETTLFLNAGLTKWSIASTASRRRIL
jgi:hypothetical protein